MDEPTYQKLADSVFRHIEDALRDVDVDRVDCERAGDVVTIAFPDGVKCVVNTQRPTRQIWVAAHAHAWHFAFADGSWVDDKDATNLLYPTLARIIKEHAGIDVVL